MSVIGVDPGLSGAFALYDPTANTLQITDMPKLMATVGKGKRERVDAAAVWDYFEFAKVLGVELVVMEQVAARPQQSGMFAFGWSCGLVYMACIAAKLRIDMATPQTWKKVMRVPGKSGMNDEAIMQRANEVLPDHRSQFYGPKGGKLVDRAEAALLALYASLQNGGVPTP